MKKKYEEPEMEAVIFGMDDIICTSTSTSGNDSDADDEEVDFG